LPGSRLSKVLPAPPLLVITRSLQSACRYSDLAGNGPDETGQLARNRGGDDVGRLAGAGELAIAGTQSGLGFPGDLADRSGLFLLSQQQLAADPRREAIAPGRLDQQPAGPRGCRPW